MYIEYCYGPKWPYLIYVAYIGLFGTGICRSVQVLYLGRAPRTKETLPDFREKCRVTRHSRVFRGLTGSQRTPGFWGVTLEEPLHVNSPLGIRARIRTISRGCELEISGTLLTVDLRILDMSKFKVILGMDWLTVYRVVIDCERRRVTAYTQDVT